jgi:hypothetical protein
MSDSTGLIVTLVLGVTGSFLFYYIGKLANALGAQIETGIVDGTPVSTKQRWLMLYNMWMSYEIGGAGIGGWLAIAQAIIASKVGDADVKLLAYLAAVFAGVGSLMFLVQGGSMLFNYRSVLHEAESA